MSRSPAGSISWIAALSMRSAACDGGAGTDGTLPCRSPLPRREPAPPGPPPRSAAGRSETSFPGPRSYIRVRFEREVSATPASWSWQPNVSVASGRLPSHLSVEMGVCVEPEWVAAGVGAVAAVVVAWQSWETRKNAKAAGDAAQAANEALALARIEEGHTRTLIAEAVKSRIDANTPSVTLVVGKPSWPPVRTLGGYAKPPEELPPGTTFTMPRDTNLGVFVRQVVTIHNARDHPIELRTAGAWHDAATWEPLGELFTVPAGGHVCGHYVVQRSLGEWVDIAERRENGDPGPEHRFELIYLDQADTGAIDNYEVVTGGVPIERVPGELGGWRIAELASGPYNHNDVMSSAVMPRRRRYWLSRTNNEQLS